MVTSVSVSISSCQSTGCPCMSALLRAKSLVGRPSMRYDATVNGAPAKPSTAVRPSSSRRIIRMASKRSGVANSASTTRRACTAAASRTGSWMTGPRPGSMLNGTPMPNSGSMMSA